MESIRNIYREQLTADNYVPVWVRKGKTAAWYSRWVRAHYAHAARKAVYGRLNNEAGHDFINHTADLHQLTVKHRPWFVPSKTDSCLPNIKLYTNLDVCMTDLFNKDQDHIHICITGVQERASGSHGTVYRALHIRTKGMPSMCGGVIIVVNYLTPRILVGQANVDSIYSQYAESRGFGVVSGGSQTYQYSGGNPLYGSAGWKGLMLVMFGKDVLPSHRSEVLKSMRTAMLVPKVPYTPTKPVTERVPSRPMITTFKEANDYTVLVSTEYNSPVIDRNNDIGSQKDLSINVREFNNTSTPIVDVAMKLQTQSIGHGTASSTALIYAALTCNTKCITKRLAIRRAFKKILPTLLPVSCYKVAVDLTAQYLITDNTVPTSHRIVNGKVTAGNIKTSDVIMFLSDPKEIKGLQRIVRELLAGMGYGEHVIPKAPLEFIQFDKANNPNEGGHPITGGLLNIVYPSKGNSKVTMTMPEVIKYEYN